MKRLFSMGKKILLIGLGAFSIGFVSGCASSSAFLDPSISLDGLDQSVETFDNSFNESQIPDQWPDYGMGDPFVFRFNGCYYVYPSTRYDQSGVRAWKSKDLMSWMPCTGEGLPKGYVLSPDYAAETLCAYAPEVTYVNGTFYLCESQSGTGHYFFSSPSPEGPFTPITGNEGNSIDGDFFLDQDENLYFLRAQDSFIRMHKLNDDFTFSNSAINIEAATMGGWTEGPNMLLRDGVYYLTFTGVHVGSAGYKVGYASLKNSDSGFVKSGYVRGDNILINTDDEWNTLGHSSTVLGPDLDSYYIAYHSRSNGKNGRQFNLSRLLFSGAAMMVDRPSLKGTVKPALADFRSYDPDRDLTTSGSFKLSGSAAPKNFTGEWNFAGENVRCVFSYASADQYDYLLLKNSAIEIHGISDGTDKLLHTIVLKKTYSLEALHTLRLSARDGKADLYFDNMEKGLRLSLPTSAGKIGYFGAGFTVGFTGYSSSSLGSSDGIVPKQDRFFADSYDQKTSNLSNSETLVSEASSKNENITAETGEKVLFLSLGDSATYKIYMDSAGLYALSLRIGSKSLGKMIGIKVDNEAMTRTFLPSSSADTEFINVETKKISLSKGEHYLTLVSDGDLIFLGGKLYESGTPGPFSSNLTSAGSDVVLRGNGMSFGESGLLTTDGDRAIAYLDRQGYDDCTVTVDLAFQKDTSVSSAGLLLRAKNDAYSSWDDGDSVQGYYFGIKNSLAFVKRCDYQAMTKQIAIDSGDFATKEKHVLVVRIFGNAMTMTLDGSLLFSLVDADAVYGGRIGLYSDGCACLFSKLDVAAI